MTDDEYGPNLWADSRSPERKAAIRREQNRARLLLLAQQIGQSMAEFGKAFDRIRAAATRDDYRGIG